MDFSFDSIDFSCITKDSSDNVISINNVDNDNSESIIYDKTTNETYRIKRLFKIDPLTDLEVPDNLAFKFSQAWNPYTGFRESDDIIGPLYFNAIILYDYYFASRYKGLWYPPQDQYQGYYGDLAGTGKNIEITSRGSNPERYLFRLPIIDSYLPHNHNYSSMTMGPELNENEISQIDSIVCQSHPKKSYSNFTSLTELKFYYDRALESSPDPNSDEIKELKQKYPTLSEKEINGKYNRYYIDKLVKIKY